MRRRTVLLALLVGVVLGSGCASLKYSSAPIEAVTADCDEHFRQWQYDIDPGDHFDAQAWSPPGFPYLRVDRFLASFELSELTPEQREEWLQRAHQKAVTAWSHEADALGGPAHDRLAALRQCGQQAIARLQGSGTGASDKGWHRLEATKAVPDSYRGLARVAGLYPLVAPVVRWRAGAVMGGLIEDYRQPYQPAYPWTVYAPPEHSRLEDRRLEDPAELLARAWRRSALGIPDFSESEARGLLSRYAPTWLLETRDDNDVPGRPARGPGGELLFEPTPVVYTRLAYTRLDGRILPQLTYLIWFAARPPAGTVDIYAGALDGFLWRVTLGEDGLPLIYDFVHPCGCYHQWLLVESGLIPGEEVPAGEEPLWIAGTVPQTDTGMALYLSTGEHQLVDAGVESSLVVSGGILGRAATHTYHFRPYDDLRGRSPAGERLFRSDGLVAGSERSERFLLWPTGVVSAGAMRQWGQHAVAFTGRRHFDDPHLLQRYFARPAVTGTGKGQPNQ